MCRPVPSPVGVRLVCLKVDDEAGQNLPERSPPFPLFLPTLDRRPPPRIPLFFLYDPYGDAFFEVQHETYASLLQIVSVSAPYRFLSSKVYFWFFSLSRIPSSFLEIFPVVVPQVIA